MFPLNFIPNNSPVEAPTASSGHECCTATFCREGKKKNLFCSHRDPCHLEKPKTGKINQAFEGKQLHLESVTFVKILIAQRFFPG